MKLTRDWLFKAVGLRRAIYCLICIAFMDTVDGSEILHHLGYIKPCNSWDTLSTLTGERRISEPSTTGWWFQWFLTFFIFTPIWGRLPI